MSEHLTQSAEFISPVRVVEGVRAVDLLLQRSRTHYPGKLPHYHPFRLAAWRSGEPIRQSVKSSLSSTLRIPIEDLNPLQRELEIHRSHAEALLVAKKLGEVRVTPESEEKWIQRALGILSASEAHRFGEIYTCLSLLPREIVDSPGKMAAALALISEQMGWATALAYGMFIAAGLRARAEFEAYGAKLDSLFERLRKSPEVERVLNIVLLDDRRPGFEDQFHLLSVLRERLWELKPRRLADFGFLLTKVVDAYLSGKPGVGDGLGLAVLDGVMVGKFGFEAHFIYSPSVICMEVLIDTQSVYWDPTKPAPLSLTPILTGRRLSALELLGLVYTKMGKAYFSQGFWESAIENYCRAIEFIPELSEVYAELAACYIRRNLPDKAIAAVESALKLDPNSVSLYHLLGNAYSLANKWRQAIAAYKKALQICPEFVEAWYNMGLVYEKMAMPEQAVAAFQRAREIKPDYSPVCLALGNIYLEQRNLSEALRWYREAIKYDPLLETAHYNLGRVYYERKEFDNAIKCYEKALELNPKYAAAWYNLGIVYRDKGDKERAVEALERAVALNPNLLR